MLLHQIIMATILPELNLNEIKNHFKNHYCIHLIGNEEIIEKLINLEIALMKFSTPTWSGCAAQGYILGTHDFIPIHKFLAYNNVIQLPGTNPGIILKNQTILNIKKPIRLLPIHYLRNHTFRVSIFHCPPYFYAFNTSFKGIEKDIIDYATKGWNVSYIIRNAGSWDLVVKDVVQNIADLAGCSQWDIKGAQVESDMPKPHGSICATFIVPKAQIDPEIVFNAFSMEIWLTVLITILVCMFFYLGFALFYKINDWSQSFLSIFRIFCSNSDPNIPEKLVLKITIILLLFSNFLLNSSYSAGIASFLTSPPLDNPLRTYKDVIDEGVQCYELDGFYVRNVMATSDNEFVKQFSKTVLSGNVSSFRNLCYSAEVYGDSYVIPENWEHNFTDHSVKILPECFGQFTLRLILRKHSPFLKAFDKSVTQFMEHGLIEGKFEQLKYEDYSILPHMQSFFTERVIIKATPLKFASIKNAFNLLLFGCCFSILALIKEICLS